MKKTLSFILSLVMVFGILTNMPLTVKAASVDDLTFELNEDGESYSVTDCNESAEGEIVIPSTYKSKPVTSIGPFVFEFCSKVTSVTIPNSIIEIGAGAFRFCSNLNSINIDSGNLNYMSEDGVLFDNKKNTLIQYPIGKTASAYVIPDTVTNVGVQSFSECKNIKSITIPDSVTNIDTQAFADCTNLISINIPDSVTIINSSVFSGCTNLASIVIPNSVTYLGGGVFSDCKSLISITIPDGVTRIDNNSFLGCTNLTSITIPNSVTSIGYSVFRDCVRLTSVKIPDSVTIMDTSVFFGCTNLTSVSLPNDITKIDYGTFACCTNLKEIVIPNNVTIIDEIAFNSCANLVSIKIPDNVTSIGYRTFYGCSNLTDVYYEGSESDWAEISIGEDNSPLTDATIHYNSTGHTHTPSSWITDKKATVNAKGSKHKECTECGEVLETATIAQLKCSKPTLKTISNTTSGVKATWGKVNGADFYAVYRKIKGGSWKKLGDAKSTSYTDKTAKSGTTYYYTVRAKNEAGLSSYNTSGLSIKRLVNPKLSKVSNTTSGVKITWDKVTGSSGYIVYRKTSGGSWKQLGKTTKTYYTDKTAKSGTTYYYTVRAYSGSVKSYYDTDGLKIKYLADPTLKTPTSTKSGVSLKWTKTTGAQGYIIYRKTGSGSYKKLKTEKGVSNLSYVDKSAKKGKKYTYKVKAYYSKTYSAYSNTKTIKDKY